MVIAHLHRQFWEKDQTRGRLWIMDDHGLRINCVTMEQPWNENRRNISCIPTGRYTVVKRWSEKYKYHFHIIDVPNRDLILIHPGNYNRDSKGCILPGEKFYDIDQDGLKDVTNSRKTFDMIMSELQDVNEFELMIT